MVYVRRWNSKDTKEAGEKKGNKNSKFPLLQHFLKCNGNVLYTRRWIEKNTDGAEEEGKEHRTQETNRSKKKKRNRTE